MSKYIETEKLIAEIERRKNILSVESPFGIGGRVELELVLDTIASLQQEQPEEKKLPSKRTRVNYAICKLQAFKPLREAIVLDGYVYDESKCYRENLVNYIHAIPENRLTEIRSYLKEKGWWPYDDDADWGKQEQPKPSSNLIDADAVRDDFVTEVYRVLDADSTNDRANAIIDAFDSLPTVLQDRPEVDYNKFEKLFDDFCESNKGHHITSHDACMWFWELGINTRKEE